MARRRSRFFLFDVGRELWAFLGVRKKYWLLPIVIVIALLAFITLVSGNLAIISPFLYAM